MGVVSLGVVADRTFPNGGVLGEGTEQLVPVLATGGISRNGGVLGQVEDGREKPGGGILGEV